MLMKWTPNGTLPLRKIWKDCEKLLESDEEVFTRLINVIWISRIVHCITETRPDWIVDVKNTCISEMKIFSRLLTNIQNKFFIFFLHKDGINLIIHLWFCAILESTFFHNVVLLNTLHIPAVDKMPLFEDFLRSSVLLFSTN